jgi:hypothetical protein
MNKHNLITYYKDGILYGIFTLHDIIDTEPQTPVWTASFPATSDRDKIPRQMLINNLDAQYEYWCDNGKGAN